MLSVLALTLDILLIAYLVRLTRTVQENRPASPPRSHSHELEPYSAR